MGLDVVFVDQYYKHLKTSEIYKILGFATHTENSERLVIYQKTSNVDTTVWARPYNMFCDGRFKLATLDDLLED